MKTVNSLVEKLQKESKTKIVKKLQSDKGQYKALLKELILQVIANLILNLGFDQVDGG